MVKSIQNIIEKARGASEEKKRLFSNFCSLSILQGANYLLPLITLPYLVRVLGPEKFGLVVFAQTFIQYFVILTDYGFNLSATREVSIHREDKQKVSEIFTSVLIIKCLLLLVSLIFLCAIVFSFSRFRGDWPLYFLVFGIVIWQILFPVWFFQGMERMKYIAFLNILTQTIFTLAVFIFIKHSSDYIYVPLINSIGFIISGSLAFIISLKYFGIRLTRVTTKHLLSTLSNGFHFFITSVFSDKLVLSTTMFLIGLFYSNATVGYFSVVTKLLNVMISIRMPITVSLYPFFNKKFEKSSTAILGVLKVQAFISLIYVPLILAMIIWAEQIIILVFGREYLQSVVLLRIASLYVLLNMYNASTGLLVMINIGLKSHLMWIKIIKYLFLLVSLLIGLQYSALIAPVIIVVAIEFAESVLYGITAIRLKIWRVHKNAKNDSWINGFLLRQDKIPTVQKMCLENGNQN